LSSFNLFKSAINLLAQLRAASPESVRTFLILNKKEKQEDLRQLRSNTVVVES